jgi:hypothetical protein
LLLPGISTLLFLGKAFSKEFGGKWKVFMQDYKIFIKIWRIDYNVA